MWDKVRDLRARKVIHQLKVIAPPSPRAGPHRTDASKRLPVGMINGANGKIAYLHSPSREWPLDQLIGKENKNAPFFLGTSRSGVKAGMAAVESTNNP